MNLGGADYALLGEALLFTALLWRKHEMLHPTALFAAFWSLTLALRVLAPMRQAPLTPLSVAVLGVGLLAVCAPAVLGATPMPLAGAVQLGDRDMCRRRMILLASGISAVVLVALSIFVRYITSYYLGADFSQLSAVEVRTAQLAGSRGGPLTLGLALAPLLGALGIYGSLRYGRRWLVLTALALFATLQYPARITTLELAASCATFWAYARPAVRQDPLAPAARRRGSMGTTVLQLTVVASAGLAYFVYTGVQLKKDLVAAFYIHDWTWPQWLLQPVQYLVGGVAGLAAAVVSPAGDPYGADGHPVTTYLLVLLSGRHPHDTLAGYTLAPFPVNVYTAFGDLFFDWGLTGVAVLSLLLGLAAQFAFRLHARGLEWAWVAAVLVNVMLSTGLAYRLLYLDVAVVTVCGWVAFRWLGRSPVMEPGPRRSFPWSRQAERPLSARSNP